MPSGVFRHGARHMEDIKHGDMCDACPPARQHHSGGEQHWRGVWPEQSAICIHWCAEHCVCCTKHRSCGWWDCGEGGDVDRAECEGWAAVHVRIGAEAHRRGKGGEQHSCGVHLTSNAAAEGGSACAAEDREQCRGSDRLISRRGVLVQPAYEGALGASKHRQCAGRDDGGGAWEWVCSRADSMPVWDEWGRGSEGRGGKLELAELHGTCSSRGGCGCGGDRQWWC